MSEMVSNDRGSARVCQDFAPIAVEVMGTDTTDWEARCPIPTYAVGTNGLLGSLSRPVSDLKDIKCATQAT